MSLDPAERAAIKAKRLKLGWDQATLAKKALVTPATISNLEGTRSKQVRQMVYARVVRALRISVDTEPADGADPHRESFVAIVDDLVYLDEAKTKIVQDLVANLAADAKKTT